MTTGHDAKGDRADDQRRSNRAMVKRLGVVVVGMFAFGFALVPFYEKICEVTGLRNIAQADVVSNTQVDATRSVRIELDSNLRNLPWTFRALEPLVSVHPGEVRQVEFEVVNTTGRAITGQAIPSYGPQYAAQYFRKLDCFCFAKQTLQPGEVRRMPVVFVIDPKAPGDLHTITLSYTFFEVEGAADARQQSRTPRSDS
ncbi:MAG: cytochrome c oxidase assembly protein [Burkholderiales bacterium]